MKYNISKEQLEELFINQNLKRTEIAEIFGCSDALIKKKLQSFGMKKPKDLESINKQRTATKHCKQCGEPFHGSPAYVRERKYCSYKCSQEASKHNRTPEEDRIKANAYGAHQRALRREAYDPTANPEKMAKFYAEAKRLTIETGIQHEVDHIHPIVKGGKHHEKNLQVLTITENRSKGAKLDWNEKNK